MSHMARAAILTLAIVPLWSSTAWAQTDADSIRALVKDGQKVVITDDQGRVIRGQISSLRADGLQLVADGQTTDVSYPDIVRIDRPPDRVRDGALNGFLVGAGFGVISMALDDCEESFFGCPGAGEYAIVALITGGLGSAIGLGIDALIRRDREIYRRGVRTTLAPVVAPGLRAARVSISW